MSIVKNVFIKSLALILLVLLFVPTILALEHSFENHKHTVCLDDSEHIHEDIVECHIDEYQFTSYNFQLNIFREYLEANVVKQPIYNTNYVVYANYTSNLNLLRGPPKFS
ncbi:hypothetical protein [Aurantibacter sp.]|uniref:hypothetical protein n=1 Tax=Aurantibacter sp. TaxID=2807103 RepID=UPI0035C7ADF8